jgi:hypothetical protein
MRLITILLTLLISTGCDPIRVISMSKIVTEPLDNSCVVQVLRSDAGVRSAGVSDAGIVYAELLIPEHLQVPESRPEVTVKDEKNDEGELEVVFSMVWVGGKGSNEYRQYVETTMARLQDSTLEKCTNPNPQ